MKNSNCKKVFCLSEQSAEFITECVFKPINATFYIDEKVFAAICDFALICSEFLNPACSFTAEQLTAEEAKLGNVLYKEIGKIKKHGDVDLDELNLRLNLCRQSDNKKLNTNYLRLLAHIGSKIEPQDDVLWRVNFDKRLAELSESLEETVEYLNTCSETELDCMSEVFEELFEHFKSQKLIDCVERNITRFDNPALQAQLKKELEYMKA